MGLYRDTHMVINLDHVAYNIQQIRGLVGENVAIGAVLKADGYGHGAVEIGQIALEEGCEMLLVATLPEAMELRNHLPEAEILIMGHTPDQLLPVVVAQGLSQTIFSYEQAVILNDEGQGLGKPISVHIKYDTGFNRLGFKDEAASIDVIKKICQMPFLNVAGIFSHLALKNESCNHDQYNKFMKAIKLLGNQGISFKYRHICDSISGVDHPEFHLDMIRPGALIYGLKSYKDRNFHLKQVMTFRTKISYLKEIRQGEGVSYDYLWQAKRDSIIATLPFGYADGYPRNMRGVGRVTIGGVQVPIIGVICMDQCMADVTDVPGVCLGDDVVIYGDGCDQTLDIHTIAQMAGTNKNELVARMTRRVPRVYIKNGQVVKVKDQLLEGEY